MLLILNPAEHNNASYNLAKRNDMNRTNWSLLLRRILNRNNKVDTIEEEKDANSSDEKSNHKNFNDNVDIRVNKPKPKKMIEHTEDPRLTSRYRRFLLKEVSRHLEEIKILRVITNNDDLWNKQEQDLFWTQISGLRETEPEAPMAIDRGMLNRRSTCVSLGRSVRFENINY